MPLISLHHCVQFLSLKSTGPFPQCGLAGVLPKHPSLPSPSFATAGFHYSKLLKSTLPRRLALRSSAPSVLPWPLSSILESLLSYCSPLLPPAQLVFIPWHPSLHGNRLHILSSSILSCVFILSPSPFLQGLFLCLHLAESQPLFPRQLPNTSVLL